MAETEENEKPRYRASAELLGRRIGISGEEFLDAVQSHVVDPSFPTPNCYSRSELLEFQRAGRWHDADRESHMAECRSCRSLMRVLVPNPEHIQELREEVERQRGAQVNAGTSSQGVWGLWGRLPSIALAAVALFFLVVIALFRPVHTNRTGSEIANSTAFEDDVSESLAHAQDLEAHGKTKESIALLQELVKKAPENVELRTALGLELYKSGDLADATLQLQQAASREPLNPAVLEGLAQAYRDAGDYRTAEQYASRLVRLFPADPNARFLLSAIELGVGSYYSAPPQSVETDHDVAEMHLQKALEDVSQKKISAAKREFQEALNKAPGFDAAANNYVSMLLATGQTGGALKIAAEHARKNRDSAGAQLLYGSVLAHEKQYPEAISYYKRAIRLDPQSRAAYEQLGSTYEVMQNLDAAISTYKQALSVNPGDTGFYTRLGTVYLAKNDINSALSNYQHALMLDPNDPVAANDVAWVYAQTQRIDEASDLAAQAAQKAPDLANINMTQAVIEYIKGNYPESIDLAEQAVTKAPHNADFRYLLAKALIGAGEDDRARQELRVSLTLQPNGIISRQAEQALSSLSASH